MRKIHQIIYTVLSYGIISGLGVLALAKDRQEYTLFEHFNIGLAGILILSGLLALWGLFSQKKEIEFAGITASIISILGYELISIIEFGVTHVIYMAILYRPLAVLFLLNRGLDIRQKIKWGNR